ncbi:MAG: hypothetical protein LUD68_05495 [Rikenellaceae bacterium]|nr:hypothetical protein [Rikenellaceae bacterium]
MAGRLRIVLTVTQGTASYQGWLSIANATVQIGTFGDYRLGPFNSIFSAGERALGVVNMLLQGTNFGLGQKVDVDGVIISGVNTQYTMPPTAYQNSQVLYLTYLTNPQQSDVDRILQWLEEQQNRVLIVQFDNSATNSNMMQTLGLNFVAGTTIAAYTFTADQAPDFIQDGVFGTVEQNFSYNCRDDTYGTLVPDNARAAGFTPVLLSQGGTPGNYVLAVNPSRRIIVCGDCDIWSNVNAGSGGYLLNLTAASSIIDPANPAHVIIGNLWAWITEIAWTVGA